jgi:hypothetical protein
MNLKALTKFAAIISFILLFGINSNLSNIRAEDGIQAQDVNEDGNELAGEDPNESDDAAKNTQYSINKELVEMPLEHKETIIKDLNGNIIEIYTYPSQIHSLILSKNHKEEISADGASKTIIINDGQHHVKFKSDIPLRDTAEQLLNEQIKSGKVNKELIDFFNSQQKDNRFIILPASLKIFLVRNGSEEKISGFKKDEYLKIKFNEIKSIYKNHNGIHIALDSHSEVSKTIIDPKSGVSNDLVQQFASNLKYFKNIDLTPVKNDKKIKPQNINLPASAKSSSDLALAQKFLSSDGKHYEINLGESTGVNKIIVKQANGKESVYTDKNAYAFKIEQKNAKTNGEIVDFSIHNGVAVFTTNGLVKVQVENERNYKLRQAQIPAEKISPEQANITRLAETNQATKEMVENANKLHLANQEKNKKKATNNNSSNQHTNNETDIQKIAMTDSGFKQKFLSSDGKHYEINLGESTSVNKIIVKQANGKESVYTNKNAYAFKIEQKNAKTNGEIVDFSIHNGVAVFTTNGLVKVQVENEHNYKLRQAQIPAEKISPEQANTTRFVETSPSTKEMVENANKLHLANQEKNKEKAKRDTKSESNEDKAKENIKPQNFASNGTSKRKDAYSADYKSYGTSEKPQDPYNADYKNESNKQKPQNFASNGTSKRKDAYSADYKSYGTSEKSQDPYNADYKNENNKQKPQNFASNGNSKRKDAYSADYKSYGTSEKSQDPYNADYKNESNKQKPQNFASDGYSERKDAYSADYKSYGTSEKPQDPYNADYKNESNKQKPQNFASNGTSKRKDAYSADYKSYGTSEKPQDPYNADYKNNQQKPNQNNQSNNNNSYQQPNNSTYVHPTKKNKYVRHNETKMNFDDDLDWIELPPVDISNGVLVGSANQ